MKSIKKTIAKIARKFASPFVSAKKRLPFQYWLNDLQGQCGGELKYLHKISAQHKTAIDIGANEGLFSYNMSRHFKKVYAFEINSDITGAIADFNPGNIEIIHKGISSKEDSATLYIPMSNGMLLPGWASLVPAEAPDIQEYVEKTVEIVTLDSFNFDEVSLIKIDVEGHEIEVVVGALETLKRNKPVVIIEVKDRNLEKVCALFDSVDYTQKPLKELIGVAGTEDDYIFVPR